MDVLLISDSKKLKELLSFQITSQLPLNIKECASTKEGLELLNRRERICDLVIAPFTGPESTVLKVMKEHKPYLPIILYFDPMIAEPSDGLFAGLKFLGIVDIANLVTGIIALLKTHIDGEGITLDPSEFCQIRTSLLLMTNPLQSDLFIRLSSTKFLKVFNSGSQFGKDDLTKYEGKEIDYLFVRRTESDHFIQRFKQELEAMLAKSDLKPKEALKVVEQTQEAIQELVNRVGFTEEVQILAKQNVQLTLKAVGKNPQLKELLTKIQSNTNYISYHSTLLAEISCCLAKEMEWQSEASFSKLVLAALMHDVSVQDPELAKLITSDDLKTLGSKFSPETIRDYLLHPAKSADVIRSFKEIPADVDTIVAQHHEQPDGNGFPRKMTSAQIAPLSSLFIVAHDLTKEMIEKNTSFNIQDFINARTKYYSSGNFRKVLSVLSKLKL